MSDAKRGLGRDVYIALAAVGWADGKLDQDEADAIVRTALEEGLDIDAISEIEDATKQPVDLGVVDRKNLSKEDRLFVYAVASWMTRLDGSVTPEETRTLHELAVSLKIPDRARELVDGIAQEIAHRSDDRPARFDLAALRRAIGDRLRAAEELRRGS